MSFKDFEQEVNNSRPRLALSYLVPIVEELIKSNEDISKELAALKAELDVEKPKPAARKRTAKAAEKEPAKKVDEKPEAVDTKE